MNNNYFEAVEVCPHCMSENIYPMWDTEKLGFVAVCKSCGKEIFLCDECIHVDIENGVEHDCDWCETKCGGKCRRGETREYCISEEDFYKDLLMEQQEQM